MGTEVLPWYCHFENWVPAYSNRVGASARPISVNRSEPKPAENGPRPGAGGLPNRYPDPVRA